MIIFITGGVLSSLGKGIAASTLGALLRAHGFSVRLKKFDPYLNVDPGTMNPYQHGEVFVTEDGGEVDLDFGSYERFTDVSSESIDSVTTGKIYLNVIEKERRGDYLGQTIQVIPHITDEIKRAILSYKEEVIICEIGGTVGDIESLPFLEAIRQIRHEIGIKKSLFIHMAWTPYFSGEIKTKPLQHSVKELQRCGIQPDLLMCRCEGSLPLNIKQKISLFCNIDSQKVIEARNVDNIYETPLVYHEAGLDKAVLRHFDHSYRDPPLDLWRRIQEKAYKQQIAIGIIGKYTRLPDAYRSVIEALHHGAMAHAVNVKIHLIDAQDLEKTEEKVFLGALNGILIPGGFGTRGIEGMITAITYARLHQIPFLGICLGFQLAIIETARSLAGLPHASSSEFGPTPDPVVALLMEWMSQDKICSYNADMGATMRLGAALCLLEKDSVIYRIYGKESISERHRHRYEVNDTYRPVLEKAGLKISGTSRGLVECIERPDHPWFIGTQFHPEFKSRPFSPHPLFVSFIKAAIDYDARKHQEETCADT